MVSIIVPPGKHSLYIALRYNIPNRSINTSVPFIAFLILLYLGDVEHNFSDFNTFHKPFQADSIVRVSLIQNFAKPYSFLLLI